MIDLDQLRKEEQALREMRAVIQRSARLAGPAGEHVQTLAEIHERLCEIADELRGECIVA